MSRSMVFAFTWVCLATVGLAACQKPKAADLPPTEVDSATPAPVSNSAPLAGGEGSGCTPAAPQGPVPVMTVKVYNNSGTHHIFPVIESGPGATDTWMQAYFGLAKADLAANPFKRNRIYRIFVNPKTGLAPNSSATIELPLYSQLAPGCIDPNQDDQFIDWWQGGRLNVFASPTAEPPPALTQEHGSSGEQIPMAANPPVCATCNAVEVYASSGGVLANNEPTQVSEWTFGANIVNPDASAGAPYYLLDTTNVDFDVSYVNNAFLPMAMETYIPEDDPQYFNYPGYIGAVVAIDTVRSAIDKFLADYAGWPQYVQDIGGSSTTHLKVPSPLELFAVMQNTRPDCGADCNEFIPAPTFSALPQSGATVPPEGLWPPLASMVKLWQDCTVTNASGPVCDDLRSLRDLFTENHKTYVDLYKKADSPCDQATEPVPLNLSTMVAHVYGWTQFNAGCAADWNLLYGSPIIPGTDPAQYKYPQLPKVNVDDYQRLKQIFDKLNLDHPEFNPYVKLIHDPDYMNTPGAYAFSVDDALGNMQAYGKGVILSIGENTNGFPNPSAATPPVNLNYGFGSTNPVNFKTFSVCHDGRPIADNPNFHSVTIWKNPLADCPVWFEDNRGEKYTLTITQQPPFPAEVTCGLPNQAPNCKSGGTQYVDCSGNPEGSVGRQWCEQPGAITVQTITDQEGHQSHNVVVGGPPQPGPYDPATQFAVYLGIQEGQTWTGYSVCSDENRKSLDGSAAFYVTATADSLAYPCTVTVYAQAGDGASKAYQFRVLKPVNQWDDFQPGNPPHDVSVIDCNANPADNCWCPFIVETSSSTKRELNVNPPGCLP